MEEKHFNKMNEDYQDWLINGENSIGKEKTADKIITYKKSTLEFKLKNIEKVIEDLRPLKHIAPHDFGYWCGQYDLLKDLIS